MKHQAFNPYLPSYEYVPDGEPHIFGDRVYVYGSHDKFGGNAFCLNDYVCWSAPTDDLGDWRFEGEIYKKTQDPLNPKGKQRMNAPDVCKGADGRYYLYYQLHAAKELSVAVCDTPAGKYEFLGYVKYPDGHSLGSKKGEVYPFDPGVFVDDDGRVYLYIGFSPTGAFLKLMQIRGNVLDGAYFVELEKDMFTIKTEPKLIAAGDIKADGAEFKAHPFFEASSMRKVKGKYYFVYSSLLSHELCYATSDKPDGGFVYGGTLVSNGDIGLTNDGKPRNYTGNTHGSICEIGGQWYVFYHRQTNRSEYSRQGCAEHIEIMLDGRIPQAEMTSCGLNGGPLLGIGEYEARIACNLAGTYGAQGTADKRNKLHPYFTQSGIDRGKDGDQYIANLCDGACCGFKYFDFKGAKKISVTVRGSGGSLKVSTEKGGKPCAEIEIKPSKSFVTFSAPLKLQDGIHALYFEYKGKGAVDFKSLSLESIP
jgi:hypothetical protein